VYLVPDVLIEREIMLLTSVLFDFWKDFLLAIPAYLPGAIFRADVSAAEGEFLVPFSDEGPFAGFCSVKFLP